MERGSTLHYRSEGLVCPMITKGGYGGIGINICDSAQCYAQISIKQAGSTIRILPTQTYLLGTRDMSIFEVPITSTVLHIKDPIWHKI